MSKQEQLEVLDNMAKHEEMLAQLYDAYGVQMPDQHEFWKRFKDEEEIHAQWIRNFMKEVDSGKVEVDPQRFPSAAILSSISYIRSLKNEAMQGGMDFAQQLGAAMEMERALLDNRYFEVIKTDDPELKILMDKLRIATDVHRERLYEELQKYRK